MANLPMDKLSLCHYYEDMCERNNSTWFMSHAAWQGVWKGFANLPDLLQRRLIMGGFHGAPSDVLQLIEDPQKRGFLLLVSVNTPFKMNNERELSIYFTLVDNPSRKQGVLRSMFQQVVVEYPNHRLWVECNDENLELWQEHFGFKIHQKASSSLRMATLRKDAPMMTALTRLSK